MCGYNIVYPLFNGIAMHQAIKLSLSKTVSLRPSGLFHLLDSVNLSNASLAFQHVFFALVHVPVYPIFCFCPL